MGKMAFGCRAVSYRRTLSKNCAAINLDAVLRADLAPGSEADGTKNCPITNVRICTLAVWTSQASLSTEQDSPVTCQIAVVNRSDDKAFAGALSWRRSP